MPRRYDRNPMNELSRLLAKRSQSDILKALSDILQAPNEHLSVGEIASLGAACENLGIILLSKARELALPRVLDGKSFTDDQITFDLWGGYEFQRIDSDLIRKRFPPEHHGELYKTEFRKGIAAIHVLQRNEGE